MRLSQESAFVFDFDKIPTGPFDTWLWWLLFLVIIALLFTLQGLEAAVEGFWPHQRRDNQYVPGAKGIQPAWSLAALLIVPGGLALIGIIATMIWQKQSATDGAIMGGWLLALGWVLFLLFGLNIAGLGKVLGSLGMLGPVAIAMVLLIADFLLIVTFFDILPAWDVVRTGVENGIETLLPFVDFDNS